MEKELKEIKKQIISGMFDFLRDCDGSYNFFDILRVDRILKKYYQQISKCDINQKSNFQEIVKKTVLALNRLNDKCECCLIETDQREEICEFMIKTAFVYNLIQDENLDITEEWREW